MNLVNTAGIAIKAIFTNKVRSALTMLGVIIGVSSVVLLISIGKGLEAYITQQFDDLGTNNIFISPGKIFDEEGGFNSPDRQMLQAISMRFSPQDVNKIERLRDHLIGVAYYSPFLDTIKFLDSTEDATVLGVNADYQKILSTNLEKGRWFNHSEADSAERVVVLGWQIYQDLFGEIDPINKKIRVGTLTFTVVGVAEEIGGGFGGPSFDTYVYTPFDTTSRIYNNNQITDVVAKAKSNIEIKDAIAAIESTLLESYDEDDFSVYDQAELLKVITDILGMLTVGLGGIAAISLLVGGIGIMNIMLVSVTERTKEIGLRKALGATPHLILVQFLIEAAFLSVFGGLIGLLLAYAGSLAIQQFFPAKVTWDAVALAFFVSTAVGLIFGATPAKKASKLSPIEALRYE